MVEAKCPEHPEGKLYMTSGDGVLLGSCPVCHKSIVRINPRTGIEEWLDGRSPWTTDELRPVESSETGEPLSKEHWETMADTIHEAFRPPAPKSASPPLRKPYMRWWMMGRRLRGRR